MPSRLRLLARSRSTARRCATGATYGAAVAWWCAYGVVYTGFGVVFSGVALVATSLVACLCWIISGE